MYITERMSRNSSRIAGSEQICVCRHEELTDWMFDTAAMIWKQTETIRICVSCTMRKRGAASISSPMKAAAKL